MLEGFEITYILLLSFLGKVLDVLISSVSSSYQIICLCASYTSRIIFQITGRDQVHAEMIGISVIKIKASLLSDA